jgi:hypothetical protein
LERMTLDQVAQRLAWIKKQQRNVEGVRDG